MLAISKFLPVIYYNNLNCLFLMPKILLKKGFIKLILLLILTKF